MKHSLILFVALLLMSWEAKPRTLKVLFRQPEITNAKGVEACVIGETQPQGQRFYIRLGNYGKNTPIVPQCFDVSRFTGLQVPADHQRGPQGAGTGTTVQVRGRELGIWIDSDHPRPVLGALLPVCPGYWWWDYAHAPQPWSKNVAELAMIFEMKVPTVSRENGAELYVTMNFLFLDTRSQKQFWLAAILFDLREEDQFPDTVHFDGWEGGTQIPILFSALNRRSAWLHPGQESALFTSQPFTDYRRFDVRVTADELRAAIKAMRTKFPATAIMSEDPIDYRLVHANLNPEVYSPQGSHGQVGLSLRDIRVEALNP